MQSITVNNLTKFYGKEKTIAVRDLSFTVEEGELFGLIGPDGAGKTSIFRMLTTLLLPDNGMARICGFDIVRDYKQIRKKIGYMPGRFSLYQDLTVEENLNFFATIFNTSVQKNYHLIRDIYSQIERFKDRRAGKLSGGMKQKLALCCALVHKPTVLFLDEPTTGVDPVSRKEFWEMLAKLKELGITIIVSTPYMDEAVLCDRIALIQKGEILSIDTPSGVMQSYPDDLFAVRPENMSLLLRALNSFEAKTSGYAFGESAHISFKKDSISETEIKDHFAACGLSILELSKIQPTIEDCFINLLMN